jgi:cytochrome c oxidase subunit 2
VDESQARGKALLERTACAMCHTVRATPALGTVGPDLTHLASRATIAGGMLENNTANLHAWVTHAQSLKPGAQMPDLTRYTGAELHDLVAYLQSLR